MAKTTAEVGAGMSPPLKSAIVTRYAKKFNLLPNEEHAGHPMWTDADVKRITVHKEQMDKGLRCKHCGQTKHPILHPEPAEVIATDEVPNAE